uniref:CSON011133 protein n=1 Tax=Culicoides sonorensis TaxID=179676 RepID=A0A336LIL1_CULSO
MAGADSGAEKLTGLSKIFNSSTSAGRANVAKATYAALGLLIVYLSVKPKKNDTFYFFDVSLIKPSVDIDLGRSIGKPRARSHTSEARTPKARETPNNTV